MEKNLVYTTCGTCSKLLDVTVENDRVKRVQFIGGCHGNSQGIAALIAGMEVDKAIARLSGIDCGGRGTSCPDQLAKALTQLKTAGSRRKPAFRPPRRTINLRSGILRTAEGKLRRYEANTPQNGMFSSGRMQSRTRPDYAEARNRRLETERFLQSVYETNHFRTMYFLWYLLIGLVAGWLANLLVKGHGSGLVVNLIVGIVGGILGGWILSLLGLVAVGTLGSLIASLVGAIVLLWIASLLSHKKQRQQ